MLSSTKSSRPLALGKLKLASRVICAPLAGCSDLPFRKINVKYRPGLMYCEMVKMEPLVRGSPGTRQLLDYEPAMHPIGAQLCGSKPELAAPSAKIIEELGFDVVDLNCGCPVDKVTKDGSGSGLLKEPERIGEILSNMVNAVKIPVTVKIRLGWDSSQIVARQITEIAEQAGASAITIHGRTRAQGYKGPASWTEIGECKKVAKNIVVIGNGDIFEAKDALRILEETGCDGLLLARGLMGKPWLIEDIHRTLAGEEPIKRHGSDLKETLLEAYDYIVSYRGENEEKAIYDLRRVGCWYLRSCVGVRHLREAINHSHSLSEIRTLITQFSWQDAAIGQRESESNALESCEAAC